MSFLGLRLWDTTQVKWNSLCQIFVSKNTEFKKSSIDLRIYITKLSFLLLPGEVVVSKTQWRVQSPNPTLWLLLHLFPPVVILIITLIIIPVILKVAVHSELLHLVWVLVTLLSLQDCVSLLFITGGVRSYPVFINVYNNTQKVLILLNIWSRGKITVFDASKRLYVHSTLFWAQREAQGMLLPICLYVWHNQSIIIRFIESEPMSTSFYLRWIFNASIKLNSRQIEIDWFYGRDVRDSSPAAREKSSRRLFRDDDISLRVLFIYVISYGSLKKKMDI